MGNGNLGKCGHSGGCSSWWSKTREMVGQALIDVCPKKSGPQALRPDLESILLSLIDNDLKMMMFLIYYFIHLLYSFPFSFTNCFSSFPLFTFLSFWYVSAWHMTEHKTMNNDYRAEASVLTRRVFWSNTSKMTNK